MSLPPLPSPPRNRSRVALATSIAVFIVVVTIGSAAIVSMWAFGGVRNSSSPASTTSSQSTSGESGLQTQSSGIVISSSTALSSHSPKISQTTSYPNGRTYVNASPIYSSLGYPQVTYNSYTPYRPSLANYTLEYQTQNMTFQVGSVGGDVINLDQAVGLAAEYMKLDPSNFSLSAAVFGSGTIVNGSLTVDPTWGLDFVQTYEGFWIYGTCGDAAGSLAYSIDALTGYGTEAFQSFCQPPSSLGIHGHFELDVNESQALKVVRASTNITGVPAALTTNGTVLSISPRIVLFGPSSSNYAFNYPLNASVSGSYEFCWVIEMFSPTPGWGYQGTFAVDAQTGELLSGWAEEQFPATIMVGVTGSLNYANASNISVSPEVFYIDGGIIGSSGSLPVTVPDVVVVKPGSTGSIELNLSSTFPENVNATFTFVNPLPGIESLSNGLPPGVSVQFRPQAPVIPPNGLASTQLLISVASNAPSGTYLVEVDLVLHGPGVPFFLSVWNGAGQWPPPPAVE